MIAVAIGCVLASGSVAWAATVEVDCDDESDFCTGDPCVTQDNLVITVPNCTLDFSPRALEIDSVVKIPNGGTLSLTAGSIDIKRKIDGKHTKPSEGDGAHVSLTATGDINVGKKIDVSGRTTAGSISIDAGGNVTLEHKLRARSRGAPPTAPGGTVTVEADGEVTSTKRAKIEVRGKKKFTAAGTVEITGNVRVSLAGRIDARGLVGGTVAVMSPNGNVEIEEEVRVYGEPNDGGTINLDAPNGTITVGGKKGSLRLGGGLPGGGGDATLTAAVVDIRRINAPGNGTAQAGSIGIVAGTVSAKHLRVRGGVGGTINVQSTAGSLTIERLEGSGKTQGGTVDIDAVGDATIEGPIDVSGKDIGGEFRATVGGDLLLGKNDRVRMEAEGDTTGGVIEAIVANDLTVQGRYSAVNGGCIGLVAGGTLTITPGSTFDPPQQLTACP